MDNEYDENYRKNKIQKYHENKYTKQTKTVVSNMLPDFPFHHLLY